MVVMVVDGNNANTIQSSMFIEAMMNFLFEVEELVINI